jgi:hypothetical protein
MESLSQKFDRLLKALGELVAEEAAAIDSADYGATSEVQQRAQPLIDALATLAPSVGSAAARARLESLIKRRRRSIEVLEARMSTVQEELNGLRKSTQRVARIVPVYGRATSSPGPNRLRASG